MNEISLSKPEQDPFVEYVIGFLAQWTVDLESINTYNDLKLFLLDVTDDIYIDLIASHGRLESFKKSGKWSVDYLKELHHELMSHAKHPYGKTIRGSIFVSIKQRIEHLLHKAMVIFQNNQSLLECNTHAISLKELL